MSFREAENYGKHSRAHARISVANLLRRVIARGDAIRLAWRDEELIGGADRSADFPTAVLPVIREDCLENDDDSEPSTAIHGGQKWLLPRFPGLLVG
jgi:hypothetical protein